MFFMHAIDIYHSRVDLMLFLGGTMSVIIRDRRHHDI